MSSHTVPFGKAIDLAEKLVAMVRSESGGAVARAKALADQVAELNAEIVALKAARVALRRSIGSYKGEITKLKKKLKARRRL